MIAIGGGATGCGGATASGCTIVCVAAKGFGCDYCSDCGSSCGVDGRRGRESVIVIVIVIASGRAKGSGGGCAAAVSVMASDRVAAILVVAVACDCVCDVECS